MTSSGIVLNETRQHQPGQAVADFTISLPQTVDVCSLHVRISAGNSAGMAALSEAVEVGELQFSELKFRKVDANVLIVLYFPRTKFVQVTPQTLLLPLPLLLLLLLLLVLEVGVRVIASKETVPL